MHARALGVAGALVQLAEAAEEREVATVADVVLRTLRVAVRERAMELRHLRYFVAVAEELHFGRAAERSYISPQPFGRRIAELERELWMELFARTTRRVRLTAAGERFVTRAERILAGVDELVAEVRASGPPRDDRLAWARSPRSSSGLRTPAVVTAAVAATGLACPHGMAAAAFYPHPSVRFVPIDGPTCDMAVAVREDDGRQVVADFVRIATAIATESVVDRAA